MIEAVSCGGIVIYRGKILTLYKSYRNKYEGWVLPKGTVEPGETHEQTAVREVYEESDSEFKHCLNEFNMMPCFEYAENTVSEIENGIKNIIDNDSSYLELQIKSKKFERQSELFWRAVEYIKQSIGGSDIETTLSEVLGMTDEEIEETLGESEVQQDDIIMS